MRIISHTTNTLTARQTPFGTWAITATLFAASIWLAVEFIPARPDRAGAYVAPLLMALGSVVVAVMANRVTLRLDQTNGTAEVERRAFAWRSQRVEPLGAIRAAEVERIPGRKPFLYRLVLTLADGRRWEVANGGEGQLQRITWAVGRFLRGSGPA